MVHRKHILVRLTVLSSSIGLKTSSCSMSGSNWYGIIWPGRGGEQSLTADSESDVDDMFGLLTRGRIENSNTGLHTTTHMQVRHKLSNTIILAWRLVIGNQGALVDLTLQAKLIND